MGWFKHFSSELITSFTILAMLVVIIAKGTLSYLLGLITKEKGVNEDAFFQYTLSIFSVGLIMLIFCLLVHYSNIPFTYLIPVGIGFPILVFALRMIKILAFGYLQFGFSVFHLVLYLCVVELIPLVIFVKIITGG